MIGQTEALLLWKTYPRAAVHCQYFEGPVAKSGVNLATGLHRPYFLCGPSFVHDTLPLIAVVTLQWNSSKCCAPPPLDSAWVCHSFQTVQSCCWKYWMCHFTFILYNGLIHTINDCIELRQLHHCSSGCLHIRFREGVASYKTF